MVSLPQELPILSCTVALLRILTTLFVGCIWLTIFTSSAPYWSQIQSLLFAFVISSFLCPKSKFIAELIKIVGLIYLQFIGWLALHFPFVYGLSLLLLVLMLVYNGEICECISVLMRKCRNRAFLFKFMFSQTLKNTQNWCSANVWKIAPQQYWTTYLQRAGVCICERTGQFDCYSSYQESISLYVDKDKLCNVKCELMEIVYRRPQISEERFEPIFMFYSSTYTLPVVRILQYLVL